MKEKYIFKISRVNNTKYLQIWEYNPDTKKYDYIKACGTAENLYKALVKLAKLKNETKK
jgi:hypothetical protein